MDKADLEHAIKNKVAELEADILSPLLPLEHTRDRRIQRHTLVAVLKAMDSRVARELDLTF